MQNINPLILMGAITGKPTREEIVKILQRYYDAGFEQYMIYPRSGCELEYFSEEFLQTVETICEEAERIGYKAVWLYDEFNWPSGSCAYKVPQENPEFAAKFICAYQVDGTIKIEIKRNDKYTDLMNPAAVERFIESTHERYYQRLGKWFGSFIKGIFTDEPEIAYFRPPVSEIPLFYMGYYDGLEDDYKALTNGDLFEDIISGIRSSGKNFYPTACASLLGKRFRECFIDRIQSWCSQHNIVMTGHLMDEACTSAARIANGNILTALSGMGLPALDDIWCNTDIGMFEFLTYSTALYAIEKQGNRGGLAELYACCKCDISFDKINQILYLAAAFGVDHYLLAVAAMDPRGNSIKKEHFNPFAWDLPHMPAFRELSKSARRAAAIARKERVYDVAVRYTDDAPNIAELLRELNRKQLTWKLINNDDPMPDDVQMVLNCSNPRSPVFDEIKSRGGWTLPLLLTRYSDWFTLPEKVCLPDGTLAEDVFLRRYADGSLLVIDMAGKKRTLVLHRNNREVTFELARFGIQEFPGWKLEFDHPHVQRVEFDTNKTAIITLEKPQKLQVALRNYAGNAEVELDGTLLNADKPCCGLPESYNSLYKLAETGELQAGSHVLVLKNDIEDFGFLPAAILLGNETLPSFCGKVTQTAEVFIPENAVKLTTDHNVPPGDVELFFNGNSAGYRLTVPYEWMIPEELRGSTVEIKLVYSSSIAALFGVPWRGTDELSYALRGLFGPAYRGKPEVLEISFEYM